MIELHQFPRTWDIPNPSPACMAVETYLRMAGLPFTVVATRNPGKGPKAKLPLLVDDGEVVPDAGFILEHLKKKYGDRLDGKLDADRRARAHCLRRTFEESLYWVGLHMRWIDDAGWRAIQAPYFGHLSPLARVAVPPLVRLGMRATLAMQGLGRHDPDEILAIGSADLSAASAMLGDEPYFGGDAPASIDAIAHGFLANLYWVPIASRLLEHARSLENLVAHTHRVRERFYPPERSTPRT
jgi:glutathione S-transferase